MAKAENISVRKELRIRSGYVVAEFSKDVSEQIEEFIYSDAADKYGVPSEDRISQYVAFRKKNLDWVRGNARDGHKKKPISIKHLPEVLKITGTSVKELFSEIGIEVNWPDEQAARIAANLEILPNKEVREIWRLCSRLCARFWTEPEIVALRPARKVMLFLQRTHTTPQLSAFKSKLPAELSKRISAMSLRQVSTIPCEHLPVIAEATGTSLKWFYDMPKSLVYSKDMDIDNAMDMFLRLSPENRARIDYIVSALAKANIREGGEE